MMKVSLYKEINKERGKEKKNGCKRKGRRIIALLPHDKRSQRRGSTEKHFRFLSWGGSWSPFDPSQVRSPFSP
jgi:hypothetical protein